MGTLENLEKLVRGAKSSGQIGSLDRRRFLSSLAVGGVTLAGLNGRSGDSYEASLDAETQALNQRAFLYNVNLSSFDVWRDRRSDNRRVAGERQRILALLDPELRSFLKLRSSGFRHTFYLNLDTIAEHADRIVAEVKQRGLSAYKQQRTVYFNANSTQGRFANVLVDRDIGTTVRELSTAYTSEDIQTTTSALVREVYRGRFPRQGELARLPIRFLKYALRTGMKEGIDYHEYTLQPGQTFHNIISTYTQGDYATNLAAVLKFNSIEPDEITSLSAGVNILIPREIHRNPLQPIVVEERAPGRYVVVPEPKPTNPAETPAEAAEATERERDKTESIPELGESLDRYIDDVIAQNLQVLGQTEMPAVLTEAFNIRNSRQRNFYLNDSNLRGLARAYGTGILSYLRANPHVTKVIFDNGHGEGDPGAPDNVRNPTVYEKDFTIKIFNYLSDFLNAEKERFGRNFSVFPLNYTGGGRQRARLEWYVNEANRINTETREANGSLIDDSIYISIHINSARPDFEPPPDVRVHGRGPQPKSTELGANILSFAVPFYQANFR